MKKTFNNVLLNAFYQVFIILIPIITIPYVSRTIGPKSLGTNSFYTSISLFLGYLILMGLSQIGPKEISQADIDKRKKIFFELWTIQLMVGLIVTVLYMIFFLFSKNSFYYMLQVPYLLSIILDISWFYIGVENMKTVIVRNVAVKIITLLLILLIVKDPNDLWIYMLINSIGACVSNIFFWIGLKRYFIHDGTNINNMRLFNVKYFKNSLILLIPQIAAQFYTSIDKIVVRYFSDDIQLSFYDQSQKMARIVLAIVTSISIVLMPLVAKYDKDGDDESIVKVITTSSEITCFLSMLFTSILVLNSPVFVPWFFGNDFKDMITNMGISSFIIIPIALGSIFSNQFALAKGLYKIYSIPFIVGALINPVLNIILVSNFNSVGASFALLITEILVCFFRIYLIRKQIDVKPFLLEYFKLFCTFVIVLILGKIIYIQFHSEIITLIINSLIEFFIFLLGIYILNKKFIYRNINKIQKLLNK